MRRKIHFVKAGWKGNKLEIQPENQVELRELKAAGQIIVDSDECAFVYLAEHEEEFIYLYIHEQIWSELNKGLQQEAQLFAKGSDTSLELTGWKEELADLVDNIQGNSNYGERMVEAVEKIFLDS